MIVSLLTFLTNYTGSRGSTRREAATRQMARMAGERPPSVPGPVATFGELLRFLRRRARLTQRDLGLAVGYSEAHVCRLEQDRRPADPATVAARFLPALGLRPDSELAGRLLDLAVAARRSHRGPAVEAADGAAPPVPRQLPADIATFTGRIRELAQLNRVLATSSQPGAVVIAAIGGQPGIGKSALAVHAAHRLARRFPDGQLYVNLQGATPGLPPLEPLEALGRMLRAVGMDPTLVPTETEEAAAQYRSLLAGRRLLVVLDNARGAAQARPLLPGSPACAVLVTSRQPLVTLDGAHTLHLGTLSLEEAVELLARTGGRQRVTAEPEAAAEVVRSCGYLPLAIRIAGARLSAEPSWSVRLLTELLADAAGRLDELAAGDLALRVSFDVSLHALQHSPDRADRAAAAAFGLLSLPDAPDLGAAAAAVLLERPEPDAESLLERLVFAGLLEAPVVGRYQLHDLVRLYARQDAERRYSEAERLAALARLASFYVATAWHTLGLLRPGDPRLASAGPRWAAGGAWFADAPAALAWLEAERASLLATVAQVAEAAPAVPAELAGQLTMALFGFFDVRSYWHDGVRANQTALVLARRTGDRVAQVHACNDLGALYSMLGRYQDAIAAQRESLELCRELGDRHGLATCLSNLGVVYDQLARYQEALSCHRESLALRRELGDRRGQAICLTNLGEAYVWQGRYDEAVACQRESLAIFAELGDRRGQALSLANLGLVYDRLGRYEEALSCQRESLALCQELDNRIGQAHCLNNIGVVHARLGDTDEAVSRQRESVALFRELDNRRGHAEALRDLGDALRTAGLHRQAQSAWREALEICEALRIPLANEVKDRLTSLPADTPGDPGGA